MKFIFVCIVGLSLFGAGSLLAQQREDPDMTAYRIRNAGGISGWIPQDGIGPVLMPTTKPTPTGATIGRGVNNGVVPGWIPQDGIGPVLMPTTKPTPTGATIGGRTNSGAAPGWVPQDGIGPAMVPTNKPTPTGATIGGVPNDGNYSPWGTGIPNIIRNDNYNPNSWWRDLLNTPPGSQISWGNHNYYYHDGNFFNVVDGIYQVVLPVLGLIMNALPTSATSVPGYNNYYSYHDIYYYNTGNGYRVVAPPVGACLSNLPYFAQPVIYDGISCYKYDNVFIKPTYEPDGNFCYQVIGDVY